MTLSIFRAGCALAGFGLTLGMTGSPARAGLSDENILTPLPRDFKLGFNSENGPSELHEYVPKTETVDDWSRMITVRIVHGLTSIDPEAFAVGLRQRWVGSCAGGEANEVHRGIENGYSIVVWLYACPLNPRTGKPENMFMKVIGGADALYDVQYAYRRELSKDMITPTMSYLGSVAVCDTRGSTHPCPRGMQ